MRIHIFSLVEYPASLLRTEPNPFSTSKKQCKFHFEKHSVSKPSRGILLSCSPLREKNNFYTPQPPLRYQYASYPLVFFHHLLKIVSIQNAKKTAKI